MELIEKLRQKNPRAAGRLISMIENQNEAIKPLLTEIDRMGGNAFVVGITGPPGAGKSSLVMELGKQCRAAGYEVGIIAVDPTSPFTGGAFLGDRVRMMELAQDPGVFIRSMGSRGCLGGLAASTSDAINILDAMGKDFIIVETVGSGQSEVDIMKFSHSVLVVTIPGGGDEIQALKAGVLEIADILVVNKADLSGADRVAAHLEAMLQTSPDFHKWQWIPPVKKTSATNRTGIQELFGEILRHKDYLLSSGRYEEKQRSRRREEFLEHVMDRLKQSIKVRLDKDEEFKRILLEVENRSVDLHAATDEVIKHLI